MLDEDYSGEYLGCFKRANCFQVSLTFKQHKLIIKNCVSCAFVVPSAAAAISPGTLMLTCLKCALVIPGGFHAVGSNETPLKALVPKVASYMIFKLLK